MRKTKAFQKSCMICNQDILQNLKFNYYFTLSITDASCLIKVTTQCSNGGSNLLINLEIKLITICGNELHEDSTNMIYFLCAENIFCRILI